MPSDPLVASQKQKDASAAVQRRLDDLEIKASYTEDLLDQLNLTAHRQQELIDRLVREVVQLRQQAPSVDGGFGGAGAGASDERPPHY